MWGMFTPGIYFYLCPHVFCLCQNTSHFSSPEWVVIFVHPFPTLQTGWSSPSFELSGQLATTQIILPWCISLDNQNVSFLRAGKVLTQLCSRSSVDTDQILKYSVPFRRGCDISPVVFTSSYAKWRDYFAWLTGECEDPINHWKSLIQKVSKWSQGIMIITMNLPDSNEASCAQNIALVTALLYPARNGSFSTAFTWIIEWLIAWERNNWVFNCWERNNWMISIVWERTDWMFHCFERRTIEHETIWKRNN